MSASETTPRADATRSRLLDAATVAFADKGFHGTTTRDIASAAGMSPAALYVHHKSKEDLLYLITKAGHDGVLEVVRAGLASSADPVEQLRTVARNFVMHHAQGHTRARIVNYELAALSPEHAEEIREIRRRIGRDIRDLVEAGVASGSFTTSNPRMDAVAIISLGIDVARWYQDEGEWSPEEIGDHFAGLALRMVGVRED